VDIKRTPPKFCNVTDLCAIPHTAQSVGPGVTNQVKLVTPVIKSVLLLRRLFQLFRVFLAHTDKTGARAHFEAISFHARLELVKLLVEGLSVRAIADQLIPILFVENFVELKFVLIVDQEPACSLRDNSRALAARQQQL